MFGLGQGAGKWWCPKDRKYVKEKCGEEAKSSALETLLLIQVEVDIELICHNVSAESVLSVLRINV